MKRGSGDLLRLYTPELPQPLGPHDALTLEGQLFLENVGDRLTALVEGGATRLKALDAITMSLDGLTYRLTVKKGLHFHCGAELTAGDAVETLLAVIADERSASQFHRFVARDKAQRHGYAVYAVSRYRFEIRLTRRMQDLLSRLALPELTLRHEGGACYGGPWKVVEHDAEGFLLTVHDTHPEADQCLYREIRWERILKQPEFDAAAAADEAYIYVYAGTQLKSPQEEVLVDEICRPLEAGISYLVDLDPRSGTVPVAEVRNRIVRATRARFSRNSVWRRSPLQSLVPKSHALHVLFPAELPSDGHASKRVRIALDTSGSRDILPPRIWDELRRVAAEDFALDVAVSGTAEAESGVFDLRGIVCAVRYAHPADAYTPLAQLPEGKIERDPSKPHDACTALVRSPRIAPFLTVPFLVRTNRNLRRSDATGLFHFADVRQSERHLRKSKMQDSTLKALGAALQMFVHDVKRPFSMVQAILGLLDASPSPERSAAVATRYLPDVRKAVGSVDRLIQDILEIGSDVEPSLEDLAPADLIGGVLYELFSVDAPAGIALAYDFRHRHRLCVDPQKLSRVVSNIVANAVEAMTLPGTILFVTTEDAARRQITMTIANTGSFIPPEVLGDLFDRFFTEGKKRGTGLGLAIVKKIVLDHGGEVWCESTRDAGTRFSFTLPVAAAPCDDSGATLPRMADGSGAAPPKTAATKSAAMLASISPASILLVDDDALYLEVIQELLSEEERRRSSLRFTTARDATEAEAKIDASSFDVAIVDVDLGPDSVDGLALVRRLRARDPALRICVHSDGAPFTLQRLVVEAGGDLFLPKPMSKDHLLRLLRDRPAPGRTAPRIAVVDDDALILESWEALPGYDWRLFESPSAFLRELTRDPGYLATLACVVTDFTFPGERDGVIFATELQALRADLPIFLATDMPLVAALPPSIRARIAKDAQSGIAAIEAEIPLKRR